MATPIPPRLPAGERLRRAGIGAWSIIGILLLVATAAWFLFTIRVIFPPLVLALLLIYLLNPVVTRLERRKISRPVGAVFAVVALFGLLTLIGFIAAPFVTTQAEDYSDRWPQFRVDLANSVEDLAASVEERTGIAVDASRVSCLFGSDDDVS